MSAALKLDEEYRSTRAALVKAGIDMTDSIDALYRDWRRWHDKAQSRSAGERIEAANVDRWWALHLAQFRTLFDPPHVAARAERARKDRNPVRPRTHPVRSTGSLALSQSDSTGSFGAISLTAQRD